jgi:3-phenylpropionate/trans-cinnamate dioxygenase ferredoxin reductase component
MAGIVILGAGHAGTQAATSLRDEGYVGPVTLVSDESDLPYHKPPLSKSFMKDAEAPLQPLRGHMSYAERDITLRLGAAVKSIDRGARCLRFSDDSTLAYDRLILATGTSARRLSVPGAALEGVF